MAVASLRVERHVMFVTVMSCSRHLYGLAIWQSCGSKSSWSIGNTMATDFNFDNDVAIFAESLEALVMALEALL